MLQKMFNYLDGLKDTVINLQKELVCRQALGPDNQGQGEESKALFVKAYLESLGIQDVQEFPAKDSRVKCGYRPNLSARVYGRNKNKTLWIVSHLDVVPPGDLTLWETEPFELTQKGDLIYGRGVEDNHHGMVSSIITAKALLKYKLLPKVNLGLLFVADEETGNKYGLDFLTKNHLELFGANDCFLVPDFGSPDSSMVEVSEKGILWLKFTVLGKQCHGSTPEYGLNTLLASSRLIVKLQDLHSRFSQKDELFNPADSTFVPTKKEANVPNINTIPGKDVFYMDCRILPSYSIEKVLQAVEEINAKATNELGVQIQYEIIHRESSPPTDPKEPLIQELIQAIKNIYQIQAKPRGIGGGTVAAFLRKKNFPVAVWATLNGNAHQPNEFTSIKNIINDAKVMTSLLLQEN